MNADQANTLIRIATERRAKLAALPREQTALEALESAQIFRFASQACAWLASEARIEADTHARNEAAARQRASEARSEASAMELRIAVLELAEATPWGFA